MRTFPASKTSSVNVVRLHLPSLRERPEDIEQYAGTFLEKHKAELNHRLRFSRAAMEVLIRYPWPGNVRELQNTIERIVTVCRQDTVKADMVRQMMQEDEAAEPFSINYQTSSVEPIREALVNAHGRKAEAAKMLSISRSTLWRRMKNLSRPAYT